MSTSDELRKKELRRTIVWLGVTCFCILFSAVYEHFSHGVYSRSMILMFLYPLLGGALPAALAALPVFPDTTAAARGAWDAGIASLTAGSCMTGIFEIYGSEAPLIAVYRYAGVFFTAAGAVLYLISVLRRRAKQSG